MGPRTRSRAKVRTSDEIERESTHVATPTDKEPRQSGIQNEKEATSSYRPSILKPTCTKLLK